MTSPLAIIFVSMCYFLLGASYWGLAQNPNPSRFKTGTTFLCTGFTLVLHLLLLTGSLFQLEGIDLSFANSISLISALICLLFLATSVFSSNLSLGALIMMLAGLSLVFMGVNSEQQLIERGHADSLILHIGFSLGAYSLLCIAALQALLMAYQERQFRNHSAGRLAGSLPPLELMEKLLFQLISWGFLLLSLGLASGFMFLEDLFAQHLVHKTVLSLFGWVVFAILLWGRWRWGWRGRTAIRWSLTGFSLLLLSYLGSKFVLEIILQR